MSSFHFQDKERELNKAHVEKIYIHAPSRAEQYQIYRTRPRALACDISYVPEGVSPRTTYFRIARRARIYDHSYQERLTRRKKVRAEHQIRKQMILLAVSKQGKFIFRTQYN